MNCPVCKSEGVEIFVQEEGPGFVNESYLYCNCDSCGLEYRHRLSMTCTNGHCDYTPVTFNKINLTEYIKK